MAALLSASRSWPGLAITVTVLALNLLGDALDPRDVATEPDDRRVDDGAHAGVVRLLHLGRHSAAVGDHVAIGSCPLADLGRAPLGRGRGAAAGRSRSAMAVTMGGGPSLMYGSKALAIWDELAAAA